MHMSFLINFPFLYSEARTIWQKEKQTSTSSRLQVDSALGRERRRPSEIVEMSSSSTSSGEEDGDAEWRAAINSIATTAAFSSSNNTTRAANSFPHQEPIEENQSHQQKSQNLKHYQLKAQKLLNDMLEKTIEVVSSTNHFPHEDSVTNDGGIQLFKHAPRGIVFDHVDELQRPNKRVRILPGKEIDEKSKKFKRQLLSVAVDGTDIIAAARDACQKSLTKLEAREAAAKAATKREEERVAELKKTRGERWLCCMAKERQVKVQGR